MRPNLWVANQRPISAMNIRRESKYINSRVYETTNCKGERIKKKCLRSVDKILSKCIEAKSDTVNLKSLISQTKNLSQQSSSHFLNRIKYSKYKILPSSTIRFSKQYKIQNELRSRQTIERKPPELSQSQSTGAIASKNLKNQQSQIDTHKTNGKNNYSNRIFEKSKKQVILDRHGIDRFLDNIAFKKFEQLSIQSKIEKDKNQNRINEQQQIQQEIRQVVKQYKEYKYSFIYGKDGKGRFLNKDGVDLIQKCDQVLTLNPQYVFLAERLSKKIMNI